MKLPVSNSADLSAYPISRLKKVDPDKSALVSS